MAKPSITKRTTKGAALTYAELDQNFDNLRDATLTLTAGSGGTAVTADLNGTITIVAGTNVTITGDNTAKTITINSSGTGGATPAGSNQQIQYNNSGSFGASSGLVYDGTSIKVNGNLESVYSNGDEGGEIFLKKAATNTTITNGVTIDVFQNKLRFFENGGSSRGFYIDITSGGNSAGTNLVASAADNYASLGLYSDQTIASQTDTIIQWTTKSDPNNWFTGSPNYRITPTVSGRYFIALQVHWVDTFNGYQNNIQIRKNGSTASISLDHLSGASTDGLTMTAIASVVMNGSTDYIDVTGYNGYTSSANIKGDTAQTFTILEIFKI